MNRYALISKETNKVENIIIADEVFEIENYIMVLSNNTYEQEYQNYVDGNNNNDN
jgi:hypothetical protein